jgi:hypothetical protein
MGRIKKNVLIHINTGLKPVWGNRLNPGLKAGGYESGISGALARTINNDRNTISNRII